MPMHQRCSPPYDVHHHSGTGLCWLSAVDATPRKPPGPLRPIRTLRSTAPRQPAPLPEAVWINPPATSLTTAAETSSVNRNRRLSQSLVDRFSLPASVLSPQIPSRAGVGLASGEHAADGLVRGPDSTSAGSSVHPENYMVAGGPRLALLEELRNAYRFVAAQVSSLSLGGAERLDVESSDRIARVGCEALPARARFPNIVAWSYGHFLEYGSPT